MLIRHVITKLPDRKDEHIINEKVRFREVRVVTNDGEQLGTMSSQEALKEAERRELDLVCVAPKAKPPVCKIMDYSKFRYEQQRKAREAKKKQKVIELKEIRLSPTIDIGDYNTKLSRGRKFLEKGDKLKVSLRFRGRMIVHKAQGLDVVKRYGADCADVATVEQPAKMEGRNITMVLNPITKK